MSEKYLLGLDGGGTKTEVLLCTADGRVVGHAVGGPSSLTGQSERDAREHIRQALEAAGASSVHIDGFYAGISGAGLETNRRVFEKMFDELLPNADNRRTGSDAVNALSAGVGPGDGIIAIAGTGSSIFARCDGKMHRVGGCGYLLGDEGSGFDLGRRALMAALKCSDGREEHTSLLQMCEQRVKKPLLQWIPELYAGDAKAIIASFAPVLLSAALHGDKVAKREMRQAASDMAKAIEQAGKAAKSRQVVLGGSVWKNEDYRKLVHSLLGDGWSFISPELPPVYGAVVTAAAQANLPWNEDFKRNIRETLSKERIANA